MDFLWDTNILLNYLRDSPTYTELNKQHKFFAAPNQVMISIVSVGEILSLAFQLSWGEKRREKLYQILERIPTIPISRRPIVQAYSIIDAYSQGKHPNKFLPNGLTPRNMGKNDLWIAATAHSLSAKLVTTDKDFTHLDKIFLDLIEVYP